MRILSLGVLAFLVACESSPDDPASGGGQGGSTAGAAGANAGAPASSGASAGGSSVGGGGAPSAGAASAGAATGGQAAGGASGSGGAPSGGSSGSPSEGGSSGGSSGGSGGSGGNGGGGNCVANLACKLDPPPSTGDLQQDCVNRINQFLTQCACLPALKRRTDGEACANEMAKYDAEHNEAHAGVKAKICQPGGSQNSCPGYSSNNQVIGLCLQQMWDEGPPPTPDCTGACYQEYGHFINMTDPDVTQVACGFYTTPSGKVWAVQNFTR